MRVMRQLIILALVALLVTACGGGAEAPGAVEQPPAATLSGDAPEPAKPTAVPAPTDAPVVAEPTVAPTAEPTAAPTAEPTAAAAVGLSRANPAAVGEEVNGINWDFQVLEVVRGDEAWAALQAANSFNEPAPEGQEHLLVRVGVTSTHDDTESHVIGGYDFWVAGDSQQLYGIIGAVPPEPVLQGELFAGGELEGWIPYLIPAGEGNLMLMLDEGLTFDAAPYRFAALDEGATATLPADLVTVTANDLGLTRDAPAPLGQAAVTDDWEVVVLEVISGEEAWTRLQAANQFNQPPEEGLEYALARVAVRNLSANDVPLTVDSSFFSATGDANVVYDFVGAVAPEPNLSGRLFSGGRTEGWVVVNYGVGEGGRVLIFEPFLDMSGTNTRYLAVEE